MFELTKRRSSSSSLPSLEGGKMALSHRQPEAALRLQAPGTRTSKPRAWEPPSQPHPVPVARAFDADQCRTAAWVHYRPSPTQRRPAPALRRAILGDLSQAELWRRVFAMVDSPAAIASRVTERPAPTAGQGRNAKAVCDGDAGEAETARAVDNQIAPQHRAYSAFPPEKQP
jgi:hypothetical protein